MDERAKKSERVESAEAEAVQVGWCCDWMIEAMERGLVELFCGDLIINHYDNDPNRGPQSHGSSGMSFCLNCGTRIRREKQKEKHCCLPMATYRKTFPRPATKLTVRESIDDSYTATVILAKEKFCRWCGTELWRGGR